MKRSGFKGRFWQKEHFIKKCHSRVFLSGIFHVLSCNHKEKAICIHDRYVEDPRLQASGMTPYFRTASGFTLIELLVVVLIIGILAAVAVPQYQKAVLKSRATQMLVRVKAVHDGAEMYYLDNGTYPSDIRKVDLDVTEGAEIKRSEFFTSTNILATFYPDGMECIVIETHYVACATMTGHLFIQHTLDHASARSEVARLGKISCCGRADTLADTVCRSMANKTTRDWGNGTTNHNCYYLN